MADNEGILARALYDEQSLGKERAIKIVRQGAQPKHTRRKRDALWTDAEAEYRLKARKLLALFEREMQVEGIRQAMEAMKGVVVTSEDSPIGVAHKMQVAVEKLAG